MEKITGGFGKSFLVAGFLPVLIFWVAVDWLTPGQTRLTDIEFLGLKDGIYFLLGPSLGFVLLAINSLLLNFYRKGPFLLNGWLKKGKLKKYDNSFVALQDRQKILQDKMEMGNEQEIEEARSKLEVVYMRMENEDLFQRLPDSKERVMPTEFGNSFAVMEAYPYRRYGMNIAIYWPRLAAVIPKEYGEKLADLKTSLDFLVNLSVMALIFGLQALIRAWWPFNLIWIGYGIGGILIAYFLYLISIRTLTSLGTLTMACFDLFRYDLLAKYQLSPPQTLEEEREVWSNLANFVRRGEAFYYPTPPVADKHKNSEDC